MLKIWPKLKWALLIILSGILIFSGYKLTTYVFDSIENERLNNQFSIEVDATVLQTQSKENKETANNGKDNQEAIKEWQENQPEEQQNFSDQYTSLLAVNKDIVGWITIPDTDINYPVVKGEDNDFYLNHNIKQKKSAHGAIFMDDGNFGDERDVNTVIYGHNMKDGSMFNALKGYKNASFLEQHPVIRYHSLDKPQKWEIFSVYNAKATENPIQLAFGSTQEYAQYINRLKKQSMYEVDVEVRETNRILTLVTCTYENNDTRLIVHAVKK